MITATISNKVIDNSNFKNLAVAEDNIDTIRFSLAKTYEGTDLSTGTVYTLWTIPGGDGDMTELSTSTDDTNIYADWELKDGVVSRKGQVEFQLVILIGESTVYKTKATKLFVDKKLNPSTLEFTADVLTAHLASVIAARDRAETAASEAEAVLADTDFQSVAADLALGASSTIKIVSTDIADVSTVAEKIADVSIVADGIGDIDRVEDIAADVSAVALIASDVSAVALIDDKVSAVADDATDIGTVATDLALGASSNIKKVAAIDSDVSAVAAVDTEVAALGARTTEIDALYAEIDQIGAKATVESVEDLAGAGRTTETVKQNADDISQKILAQPYQTIDYSTNCFTNGRACETKHELYLAGKYLLGSVYGSLDPDNSAKALTVFITISSVEYAGLMTHEWNSGSPRLKFIYSGGTAYYEKDDATALDSSIRVYNGALRNLSGEKDLRYDLPSSIVAMYSAGDQRNSLRWTSVDSVANEVLSAELFSNNDFSGGTTGFTGIASTLSESGGVLSVTGDGLTPTPRFYQSSVLKQSSPHRYKTRVRVTNANCQNILLLDFTGVIIATLVATPVINTWYDIDIYVVNQDNLNDFVLSHRYADSATANGSVMEVEYVSIKEVLSGDITGTAYVEEAHDIVGTNDATQSTEAIQPLISGNGFDTSISVGGGFLFSCPLSSLSQPWWFAIKVNFNTIVPTGGYSQSLLMLYLTYSIRFRVESDGSIRALTNIGTPREFNTSITTGVDYRLILTFDGADFRLWLNGIEITDSSATAGAGANVNRLLSYSDSGGALDATSYLPMLGQGSITPTEIAQLDAILEAE